MVAMMVLIALGSDLGTQRLARVMRDFGYPSFRATSKEETVSGGLAASDGRMSITLDAAGVPHRFAIRGVRFERSNAKEARYRISGLLQRYPLPLGEGKWVTERSLSADPIGNASSSMRYFFVPHRFGYPFLRCSFMTAQVSSDVKRVLEWKFHKVQVAEPQRPRGVVPTSKAIAIMKAYLAPIRIQGNPYTLNTKRIELGWDDIRQPRLVYAAIATAPINTSRGPSLSAISVAIDAQTGAVLSPAPRP